MANKQGFMLFLLLFVCSAFIFSITHFGAPLVETYISGSEKGYASGTKLGVVDVSGKTEEEALNLVNEQLGKWNKNTSINLKYREKKVPVDLSQFKFDLESSLDNLVEGQKNPIDVTYKPGDFYQFIKAASETLDSTSVEVDAILAEMLAFAADLNPGQYELKVENFLAGGAVEDKVVAKASITPGHVPIELALMIEELSPIVIEPQSRISFVDLMEEKNLTELHPEAASMIASTIFKAILPTNFVIIEKHIGQELPDYLALGYEAKVDPNKHLDFIFANPNDNRFELELELNNNVLTAGLKGVEFLNKYEVTLEDKQEFAPKTIIQFSPSLGPNATRVKRAGVEGLLVKVYRKILDENDNLLSKEFISEDFYPPIHTIEIHGVKPAKTDNSGDGGNTQENPDGENPDGEPPNDGTNNGAGNKDDDSSPDPDGDEDDEDDGFYGNPNDDDTLK